MAAARDVEARRRRSRAGATSSRSRRGRRGRRRRRSARSAPAALEMPSARAVTSPTRSANRRSSSASALSAACEILVSSSPSSTVVKRMALAMVWRWMKRGVGLHLVGMRGRRLDEIAEHIVVLDLERADADVAAIARLQLQDQLARIVAQRAPLVEVRQIARRDEAAVAREQRQARRPARASGGRPARHDGRDRSAPVAASGGGEPKRASANKRLDAGAPPAGRRGSRRGRAGRRGPATGARARVPGPAPASGARAGPRAGASRSSRCATASWRAAIAAMSVSGAASHSPSRRAPAPVTVRSMVASRQPCRSPVRVRAQFQVAAGGGVDLQDRAGADARELRQARHLALLGQLDIVEDARRRRRARRG